MAKTYVVHAQWDEDSKTWWTDGEDIPGLCCQAASFEELAETVFELAPRLLSANGVATAATIAVHPSVV